MNSELQFFPHPEGYVSVVKFGPDNLVINYAYQYKDHLGNIRLNYGKDPETNVLKVLEENHYYPFGLKHQNYNTGRKQYGKKEDEITTLQFPGLVLPTEEKPMVYKYKYNGKEWQDELGLNVTAMDFRMYDNALVRFHNIDVMTEIMPSLSPYRFAFNNPVIWKDPSGLSEESDVVEEHWDLDEVVLTATRKSTKSVHDTGLPYNHSYFLMPKNYRPVSTDYYNKKYGTDFKNLDDWYYRTKYLPFKEEMIKDMHSAQAKAGMAVMALVGSAFAAPILAASPLATTVSNMAYGGINKYAGMQMFANAVGQGVGNGGDVTKINPISVVASGYKGLVPLALGSTFNFSLDRLSSGQIINNSSEIGANIGTGVIGNGLMNKMQLPKSVMTDASFMTYQGMINTSINGAGTLISNEINNEK